MPYFMFRGHDGPNSAEIRGRVRPAHRDYLRQPQEGCRVAAGGVLTDDGGGRMLGTLLIFDAVDRAAVDRFLAGDPYAREGLFERTEVIRWDWGLNPPG